jgi:2-haloalkanoic acid dehalogenase type II
MLNEMAARPRYRAVLFDLLTALLDSWTLWNAVAGGERAGRSWREAYLAITYRTGRYLPYEDLVARAAEVVGLPRALGAELAARYAEIEPWPESGDVLAALRLAGVRLAIVTNCSERLGRLAASRIPVAFDALVTAERAGSYKPEPKPYLLALEELGAPPEHCLFVAGSAYDLSGAAGVGLSVWWHDRIGMAVPPGAPAPTARHRTLRQLPADVLATERLCR